MILRRLSAFFPTYIITLIRLFLLEFTLLSCCRLIFYFAFKTIDVGSVDGFVILKAFRMGFEFDMVASTYALLLPALLLLLNEFFFQKTVVFQKLAFVFTLLIFWLYALISAADFPYYLQFGSHLNKQAFLWAASPAFVIKLILGSFSYYGYLFLFLLFAFVIYNFVKRIFSLAAIQLTENPGRTLKTTLSFLLLIPFLIAGARGRLSSKSTTHEGLAIVSDNLFVNQVALNPNFTMFRSLFFQKVKNYKIPDDIDTSIAYARNYLGIKGPFSRSIARKQLADSAFRPFNVVIVCMESMSSYKTGKHGTVNLTPNLNALSKQSLYFDNFFSTGIHTFNGLFSTCSGYPCMLNEQGLRHYTKKPFVTLANLLLKKNYQTYLAVTHDPVFDNMEGFFRLNGYENTLSSYDFPSSKVISVTGVPDHELFNHFINTINTADKNKPFLGFIMTGSDHGPWAIPDDIPFVPNAPLKEQRSSQYADWAIGEFINNCKRQNWFKNTLFVFLGDHGFYMDGTYEMPLSYQNTPFILYKPNTLKPEMNSAPSYQPDVLSTVAGILNLSFENTGFGIDLRKEKHPFVFFTADDKIGCVDSAGNYFYELITQKTKRLLKYKNLDRMDYYNQNKSKADSLEKGAKKLLDAAEYFIRQEYFTY